jgi:hypothetical protein
MRRVLVLLSCNCGHLSSVSMFVTRAGVMESIAGVSGRSALDHFEFTDVRFGMRVPDTATVF